MEPATEQMVPNNTTDILGIQIPQLTCAEALERVKPLVAERRSAIAYFINAHCANLACSDPSYRELLNQADLLLNDGTGVGWAARRQGQPFPENNCGTDFIPMLCDQTRSEGYSFFLLGSQEGVPEKAAEIWCKKYPGLKIAGTHHGYIDDDPKLEDQVIRQINDAGTDVLLVAMGMPKQEQWIHENRERLNVGISFAVGALFDFTSGALPRAPQWMLDRGWEWLYRLAAEPRRLWRRYIIGNPLFITRVLRAHRKAGER